MLATMFQFNSPSGFRGDNFLEINPSETRIACGGHVFNAWEINEQSLYRTFQGYFLPNFDSFGQVVSERIL